jgi:uncharacterized protein
LNCPPFALLLVALSLVASSSFAQQAQPTQPDEIWFGWVESPSQHLRTVLRIKRVIGQDGKLTSTSGTIASPDQSAEALPLANLIVPTDDLKRWSFDLLGSNNLPVASFLGAQTGDGQLEGILNQNSQETKIRLQRLSTEPIENPNTFGADDVWLGALKMGSRSQDYRIRIYRSPPFGKPDSPRILFDSLTKGIIGVPTTVSFDGNRMATFEMQSSGSQLVAQLNDAGTKLSGNLIQNKLTLPLTMTLVQETDEIASPSDAMDETMDKSDVSMDESDGSKTQPPLVSSDQFTESYFVIPIGPSPKPKKPIKSNNDKTQPAESQLKIAGTLTLPKKGTLGVKNFPAVVMVTGTGPQDRNESVGRHRPFEVLAHYLADRGIASLRYDDRSVGASTGDFYLSTSADFANDAAAVWKYATKVPELDATRVGILGHSEGGMIGTMVASWEMKVAFLILLAPTGISGNDVLLSQVDRMAEINGVDAEGRNATLALQQQLQDIATGYYANESDLNRDVRSAVNRAWIDLEPMAKQQPNVDLAQVKQNMMAQIGQQMNQLRTPWYKYFLSYDPGSTWMLIRCPTLAIWGERDIQVIPELNRNAIANLIKRNISIDATLLTLPGLNHLLQTSRTGLPDEYDQIDEAISPEALKTISDWATAQGVIEPK